MEKRLLTDRFALRFGTTIYGILFTDAFFAYRYFNNLEIADFREEMNNLAYALMHNPDVDPPSTAPPKGKKRARRSSPNSGGVCSGTSGDGKYHPLVKMKSVPRYVGGKDGRQRCMICSNQKTIWCCLDCSEAPHSLVPICPTSSNKHGTVTQHLCYDKHCDNPTWMPKGRTPKGGYKRRRTPIDSDDLDTEDPCDDCEGDDVDSDADSM